MLIRPSALRSPEALYLLSPFAESYAKAIWATSSILIAPSWFRSGSRDKEQPALLLEMLTVHAAPCQEALAGMARTNPAVESRPYPTVTLYVLEKFVCPVVPFVAVTEIVAATVP